MRKIIGLAIVLAFITPSIHAQEYFQQNVAYDISVSLDDEAHVLNGMLNLTYTNNSSSTLDFIYFHLWPKAYADFESELSDQLDEMGQYNYHFSSKEERGNIDGFRWTVDGVEASMTSEIGGSDEGKLVLPQNLEPGMSCVIRTPFQVKIPSGAFSRLGHVGQSYQITQWYPKPAVFDNKGWHPMPYLTQGEFYSEFGSFKVSITLPKNYIVGATGVMQNKEEYEYMKSLSTRMTVQDSNDFPPSSEETKTLTFIQDKVHDFAWFADKRFNVLYDKVELPDSKDSIDAWVLYTNMHMAAWQKSMEYVKDGIIHYSKYVGDYPYSHATVIDGTLSAGGGMEYPMITVINGTSNDMSLEQVVVHELGHNWFYGILGSNERDHAWMDEGINTYYETRYFEEKYPGHEGGFLSRLGLNGRQVHEIGYLFNARKHQDQGLDVSSADYTTMNYGVMVYSKGGYIMQHLASILGQDEFDEAMHAYFNDWKFKHPYPDDMEASLERATGKNLDWFYTDLAVGTRKLNYSLKSHADHEHEGMLSVTLKEKSGSSSPVIIGMYKAGECIQEQVLSPGENLQVDPSHIEELRIDPECAVLDLNRRNNSLRTSGLFKSCQGPQIKLFAGIGNSDLPSIYVMPVLGINGNDKWMPGLYLSNRELLAKNFEFSLLPLFGTGSEEFVGMGDVVKTFYPNDGPSHFDVAVNYRRFSSGIRGTDLAGNEVQGDQSVYSAFRPSLSYVYVPLGLKKGEHRFTYSYHRIENNWNTISANCADLALNLSLDLVHEYHVLSYAHQRTEGLTEWAVNSEIEGHSTYGKMEVSLEASHAFNDRGDRFSWRVYGAKMWVGDECIPKGAALDLSGQDGSVNLDGTSEDYRYEQLFLHRNGGSSLAANQMVRNRGGFVQTSYYGGTDNWLASLNLEADLPIPVPISAYANFGVYHTKGSLTATKGTIEPLYEAGMRIILLRDLMDVSFPMILYKDIKDSYTFNDISYGQTIRFQFRLDKMNLRTLRNAIDL